jgi:hypothetical protein
MYRVLLVGGTAALVLGFSLATIVGCKPVSELYAWLQF